MLQLAERIQALLEYRRTHRAGPEPAKDPLSNLIAAQEQGSVLNEAEIIATCVLLIAAGHHTATNLIANGMLLLLQHPQEMQALKDDCSLAGTAIGEILRYGSPVQNVARIAVQDVEIDGKTIGE